MSDINPNCDGGHCRHHDDEVRLYPLGGGYFEHREPLPLSGPVSEVLIEWNEGLWQALCATGEVLTGMEPPAAHPLPVNTTSGRPARLGGEFTGKEARAAYMRAYMRRRRRERRARS